MRVGLVVGVLLLLGGIAGVLSVGESRAFNANVGATWCVGACAGSSPPPPPGGTWVGGDAPSALILPNPASDGITYTFTISPNGTIQNTPRAIAFYQDIMTVTWDFGDGGTATGYPVTHTFVPGYEYRVTAKITFTTGESETVETTVHPGALGLLTLGMGVAVGLAVLGGVIALVSRGRRRRRR